jgi:hypothetical protein
VGAEGCKEGDKIGLASGGVMDDAGIMRPMTAERRYEARGVSERAESCSPSGIEGKGVMVMVVGRRKRAKLTFSLRNLSNRLRDLVGGRVE